MKVLSQTIARPTSKSSTLKAIKQFGSSWITVGLLAGGIAAAVLAQPKKDNFTKTQDTATLNSGTSSSEKANNPCQKAAMFSMFRNPGLAGYYLGKCQAQNASK